MNHFNLGLSNIKQLSLKWQFLILLLNFNIILLQTNVGPVLLHVNPYKHKGNPLTLSSVHQEASKYPQLLRVVREAVREQSETSYPQAIILRLVSTECQKNLTLKFGISFKLNHWLETWDSC